MKLIGYFLLIPASFIAVTQLLDRIAYLPLPISLPLSAITAVLFLGYPFYRISRYL